MTNEECRANCLRHDACVAYEYTHMHEYRRCELHKTMPTHAVPNPGTSCYQRPVASKQRASPPPPPASIVLEPPSPQSTHPAPAASSSRGSAACPPCPDVLVLGSSVALGQNAEPLSLGWANLLGSQLALRFGLSMRNAAIPGSTTGDAISALKSAIAAGEQDQCNPPRAVLFAYSLANEGLRGKTNIADARQLAWVFEARLQAVAYTAIDMTGASVVLASVYPNDEYNEVHYQVLKETHAFMQTWSWPMIDLLTPLDDGHGRWVPGTAYDSGHPNTRGHALMFESVDIDRLFRNIPASGSACFGASPGIG